MRDLSTLKKSDEILFHIWRQLPFFRPRKGRLKRLDKVHLSFHHFILDHQTTTSWIKKIENMVALDIPKRFVPSILLFAKLAKICSNAWKLGLGGVWGGVWERTVFSKLLSRVVPWRYRKWLLMCLIISYFYSSYSHVFFWYMCLYILFIFN